VHLVEVASQSILLDIDEPADYKDLQSYSSKTE
jgi:CTP:molybdopterin cytidylyltransferase MocA